MRHDPARLRAAIAARKRRLRPTSPWGIVEESAGPNWFDGLWSPGGRALIAYEIHWNRDDPAWVMLDPADHPWLTPAEVETINWPHRRDHIVRMAVEGASLDYVRIIEAKKARALIRDEVGRERWNGAAVVDLPYGGWLAIGAVPVLRRNGLHAYVMDGIAARHAAKAARDWPLADAIRRECEAGRYELIDHRGGTEWVLHWWE